MNSRIIKAISVLVILFSLSAAAQDIPFFWGNHWTAGGRAAGMGGAFTGVASGEGAFIYNPAGLGLAKSTEFYGSFSRISHQNDALSLGTQSGEDLVNTGINSLGISVPLPTSQGSLVFGIGYHRVIDYNRSLFISPFDPAVNDSLSRSYTEIEKGGLDKTVIAVSMEVAPDLFIGGSLDFWSGKDELTKQYIEADDQYDLWTDNQFFITDNIISNMSGVGVTLSALMKVSPMINLGGAIISPVTFTVKEEWDYSERTEWDDGVVTNDTTDFGDYPYKIRTPWKYRFGTSLKVGPLLAAADFVLNDYTQITYKDDPPYPSSQAEANLDISRNFRNTLDYNFGGELTVPKTALCLRGGYAKRHAPYKDADTALDRTILSFGVGYMLSPQTTIDFSYSMSSWDRTNESGVDIDQEEISAKRIMVGLSHKLR